MNKDVFFRLTTSARPRKTFCVLMRNRTSDFKFLPKKRADLRPPKHKCISAGTTISISNHNSARTNSSIVYSMQIIIHCKKKKKKLIIHITPFFFFPISAFCRDRDRNCEWWKSFGMCENHGRNSSMAVYCGVTCGFCKYKCKLFQLDFFLL